MKCVKYCFYVCRNVLIHAAMLEHVDWPVALNVILVNVVLVSVTLRPLIPCANVPLDLVILMTTALATPQTVQKMRMSRIALLVTITSPTASRENATLTMISAKDTSELVSSHMHACFLHTHTHTHIPNTHTYTHTHSCTHSITTIEH